MQWISSTGNTLGRRRGPRPLTNQEPARFDKRSKWLPLAGEEQEMVQGGERNKWVLKKKMQKRSRTRSRDRTASDALKEKAKQPGG